MTKSVPRVAGYYDNILKSPLLNFANYPKSILRRLTSRGGGGESRKS